MRPSLLEIYPELGVLGDFSDRPPKRVREPLAVPVRGRKNTHAYSVHSYPTKVPPEAIEPFIAHFTEPGDVVLDPFAGSGMTGLAAIRLGRRAVLNDLGVGAVHLAWNITHHCDPARIKFAADSVLAQVQDEVTRLYSVAGRDGSEGVVEWVLHSEMLECSECGELSSVWHDGADPVSGTVRDSWPCLACGSQVIRRGARAVASRPAVLAARDSSGRFQRPVSDDDVANWSVVAVEPIVDWYPTTPLASDREMYIRSALHLRDVHSVADFYTPRNLRALARLWRAIAAWPDVRERQVLALAFTNTAWHGTRMRRYNARGGQRPLTGTLYIPQLSIEVNVASVFARKVAQIGRFYAEFPADVPPVSVVRGSATELPLGSNTVDYCFVDPPFGSNIFYADCAVVWESWLGETTDVELEAVVNRSLRPSAGGKSVDDYSTVMDGAFAEIQRVLKPGAWTTVVFQSTDAEVWSALRLAVERAGFDLGSASYLDKTQQSHKGYKGRSGAENVAAFDIVLNLHKPSHRRRLKKRRSEVEHAGDVIERHLAALAPVGSDAESDRQRTLPFLHSLLVQAHFNGSIGLEIGEFELVRRICRERFVADESGHWSLADVSATHT